MINYRKIIGAAVCMALFTAAVTACGEESAENEDVTAAVDTTSEAETSPDTESAETSAEETSSETEISSETSETDTAETSADNTDETTLSENSESNADITESEAVDSGEEYAYFEGINKANDSMSEAFIAAADKYISTGDYNDLAEIKSHAFITVIEMMTPYTENGSIEEVLDFMMEGTDYPKNINGFMEYTFDLTDFDTFNQDMAEICGNSEFVMSESDYPGFQEAVTAYMTDYFNNWIFSDDTSILTRYGASPEDVRDYYDSLSELMNIYDNIEGEDE